MSYIGYSKKYPRAQFSQNGLIAFLDAADQASYSKAGNVWGDVSGNYNSATLFNSPTFSELAGGSLLFNGSNQYAEFPANSQMNNYSSGITVIVFANFNDASNWERIIDFGSGTPSNNILLARRSTGTIMSAQVFNGSSSILIHDVDVILDNTWSMYSWSFTGSVSTIGRNGGNYVTQNTSATIPNVIRNNMYIARSNWSGDAYFESGIQSILIYNRGLSQFETTQVYNSLYRERFLV